jgi:glycosyltransferase involved in cell wall biosynthesis
LSVFFGRHDDAIAYVHTEIEGFQSPSLGRLATLWSLSPDRLLFAPQYKYKTGRFDQDYLAEIYTGGDVLLATSMGEGFGVPCIESQACGQPIIVTDFAASPELVPDNGWKASWQPFYDAAQGTMLATPLIPSIVDQLELAYAARGDQSVRDAARAHVQQYNADTVFAEGWVPYLAELEAEIARTLKPTRQQRRSKARVKR